MGQRKFFFILVPIVAILFIISPASARWSANWGTGSAIGSGGVTGLQKAKQSGASLQSAVAHPGAKFCSKSKDHDHDHDDCDGPDEVHSYNAPLSSVNPPNPGTTPGIVFCKALNYGNKIVQAKNLVNLPQSFNGTAFIPPNQIDSHGNASFNINNQVDPATLNSLFNANTICPSDDHKDDDHKDGKKDSHYDDHKTQWTLIDFVPQQFSASLQAFDSKGHLLTKAVYDCSIDLGTLKSLHYHEQKPYTCTTRLNQ